jgi:phosphatidylglycerophosphatase A
MIRNTLIKFFASGLYSGYSPVVPGTTGTVPAWLLAYFWLGHNQTVLAIAAVALSIISIYLASLAEPIMGHDSKKIVVDEWAGMMISLLLVPFGLLNYIIAFVAFRGFDAVKVFPADRAENLPRGWGVTADDIVAGVQANILTQLIVFVMARLS